MEKHSAELIGSAGLAVDTPAHKLDPAIFSDAMNVKFDDSGVESVAGDLPVFSTASIEPVWLGYFPPINAPKWVYANLKEVHVVDGTTHSEITRVSGDYNAIAEERWNASVFNGVGILNNTIDIPQAWTGFNPNTNLIDLPNWDTNRRCKSLRAFKNFLVALNMTDSSTNRPYRVLWSDSADIGTVPGSWDSTDPATDSREIDLAATPDHLVDQLPLGDVNIIYKETTTWGMQYIGPNFYFRFWKILSNCGALHRDCMGAVPLGHFVVTQDDIIIHAGQQEQFTSLVDRRLRKWVFANIDTTNYRNSYVFIHHRENAAYFCFPENGETYSSMAVVWNWIDKSITIKELPTRPAFMAVGPVGSSIVDDVEWGV